mmetsp:Transcript_25619/g.56169  ORF Transcript_25619/g.56169 Transcript_25619/m.56169 type:complete len:270 (-) Transcript_25619:281-1090(-)|eukprot:CAMPEP_0168179652 /NCGR_PEP_ID=MMETSP0139_2-20121125/9984_1 /TAXON_ID=44445 /ORGANISM="Pseudo-nitzschia australis, Strain 10249 10 AB" /LENGTH=269 /DNA_ID=CAMNT_0008099549 /DNA_START=172 /DNA_END=981 /DNA_ORIENTATION=-
MALTLTNSKYNRYNVDQRLTVDVPMMHGPLQHVPNIHEENDEHRIALTDSMKSLPSSSVSQRSIFSSYWKTAPRSSSPSSSISPRSCPVVEQEVGRGEQQRHQQRRQIHKTYAYIHLRDPYEYFGIEEEQDEYETTSDNDTDASSINSYERVLRRQEAAPYKAIGERSSTYPYFSAIDLQSIGTLLDRTKKTTQSDTVLFAKTSSLKRSCLRKGRFSFENKKSKEEDQVRPSKGVTSRTVSFESAIKICLFQTPVEKWAPRGWSNWFGA